MLGYIILAIFCTPTAWCGQNSDKSNKSFCAFNRFSWCGIISACFASSCTDDNLYKSVRSGNMAYVRDMLHSGANINCQSCSGQRTPLMVAISHQLPLIAEYLVRQGALLTLSDEYNRTALHYAAQYGDLTTTNLLLQEKANGGVVDRQGCSPLRVAVKYNHLLVVSALMRAGVVHESDAQTALTVAIARQNSRIIKELLIRGTYFEVFPFLSDSDYELQHMYHKKRFNALQSVLYDYIVPDNLVRLICEFGQIKCYA